MEKRVVQEGTEICSYFLVFLQVGVKTVSDGKGGF